MSLQMKAVKFLTSLKAVLGIYILCFLVIIMVENRDVTTSVIAVMFFVMGVNFGYRSLSNGKGTGIRRFQTDNRI